VNNLLKLVSTLWESNLSEARGCHFLLSESILELSLSVTVWANVQSVAVLVVVTPK